MRRGSISPFWVAAVAGGSSGPGPIEVSSAALNSDGTELTVTHSRDVEPYFFDYPAFALTLDSGRTVTPRFLRLSGADVILELDGPVLASETCTLAYTKPGTDPIKDAGDNEIATYSGQAVTNNSTIKSPAESMGAGYGDGWTAPNDNMGSSGDGTTITGWTAEVSANMSVEGTPTHTTSEVMGFKRLGYGDFQVEAVYTDAAGVADIPSGASIGALVMVVVWRVEGQANTAFAGWGSTTGNNYFWIRSLVSGYEIRMRNDAGSATPITLTGVDNDRVFHYAVISYAGDDGALRVDVDGTTVVDEVNRSHNGGWTSVDRFSLGGIFTGSTSVSGFTTGQVRISEGHVGDTHLTGTQFDEINAYLAAAYDNPRTQNFTTRNELANLGTPNAPALTIMHPTIVEAPGWMVSPPGNYLMWLAAHGGAEIDFAYSNTLTSGWTIDATGTDWTLTDLQAVSGEVDASDPHLSSPHVYVDNVNERFVGWAHHRDTSGHTAHCCTSTDGVNWTFVDSGAPISNAGGDATDTYFRPFKVGSTWYAIGNGGILYRSSDADGLRTYVKATDPTIFNRVATADGISIRHCGVAVNGTTLTVYFTRKQESPERVLASTVDASGDWQSWQMQTPSELIEPYYDWEGADRRVDKSSGADGNAASRELRDPAFITISGTDYLIYDGDSEGAIGIAQL